MTPVTTVSHDADGMDTGGRQVRDFPVGSDNLLVGGRVTRQIIAGDAATSGH